MSARRAPSAQGALVCEGLEPDVTTEQNISDVFALWVERIADLNAAIAAHNEQENTQ